MRIPAPGTMNLLPHAEKTVWMNATAMSASPATNSVVSEPAVAATGCCARPMSMRAACLRPCSFDSNSSSGTASKSGSAA